MAYHGSYAALLVVAIFSLGSLSIAFAVEVTDAQQIALESSGELLAPAALVQRVEKDLVSIKSQFPAVKDIKHTPKWSSGKLIISDVSKETLDKINSSKYGPSEARAIFQNSIFLVTFQKPYNPEILVKLLKKELGIANANPDGVIGESSRISLTSGAATGKNTYVFMKGSGDCPSGCINKSFWTFSVDPETGVKLVEQRNN